MQVNHRLIMALISVMDDRHGMLPDGVADAVNPGDEDEPAGNPFALRRRHLCPPTMFFTFPEDARWNSDREAVEYSVILEPYEGTVRIARRVFQRLFDQSPTPERCIEAFHLKRTSFEQIAERQVPRRQLTEDDNVEIAGRDLRAALNVHDTVHKRIENQFGPGHNFIATSNNVCARAVMSSSSHLLSFIRRRLR